MTPGDIVFPLLTAAQRAALAHRLPFTTANGKARLACLLLEGVIPTEDEDRARAKHSALTCDRGAPAPGPSHRTRHVVAALDLAALRGVPVPFEIEGRRYVAMPPARERSP